MIPKEIRVAYFCAEFGLDGFPFNGGLGILAGDFLKSCSDLGMPVVGVGLFYKMGNFHQKLDATGWQTEYYEPFIPTGLLKPIDTTIEVPTAGRNIQLNALELTIHTSIGGKDRSVRLINLNDQDKLDCLYPGGDQKVNRLIQEMELGIGGVRMLDALGYKNIQVYHSNEGHAALLTFALRQKYGSLEEARKHMIFTTHTPVPAGIDIYTKEQAEQVMPPDMLQETYSTSGKEEVHMMKLAMNSSRHSFGVSKLHQQVSKYLFGDFPNIASLDYIDDGIHLPTWISPEVERLYDKLTNKVWRNDPKVLEDALAGISEEEVLAARATSRYRLGRFLQESPRVIRNADYDPDKLIIGFARRFATYKQATLIFKKVERLRKLGKKIGLVFAGKAHPLDTGGKEVIRDILRYMQEEKGIPIWFVKDYDMTIARYLVQGVDLWLNTPERLKEAAGTSGMKAAANFVPQFSIIDGWWFPQDPPPGYKLPKGLVEGITGWGIGRMPTEKDFMLLRDTDEARAGREKDRETDAEDLTTKLESEIVPRFEPKKPWMQKTEWAKVGRGAASHNASYFNTHRMALQHLEKYGIEIN